MTPETGAFLSDFDIKNAPSLFEILSQQNMATGLRYAFQHMVKVLANHQPHNFGWLYRNCDEAFLLLNAAIQNHYLKTRGGTLSEAFYGLQRVSSTSQQNLSLHLVIDVLISYLEPKLEKFIQNLKAVDPSEVSSVEFDTRSKATILRIYSHTITILSLIKFYFYLMYILGKVKSHSALFAVFGWHLAYSKSTKADLGMHRNGWRGVLFKMGESVLPIIEIGSFLVQFINWWRIEKSDFNVLPIPEPYEDGYGLDKRKCPICNQIRKNNTAIRTSGIVYCYGCISKYLKQEQKCPVSGIASSTQHLVRIYQ